MRSDRVGKRWVQHLPSAHMANNLDQELAQE